MRAKFRVTDPAAVKGLRFNMRYRGGVVVYLNGKELARGHLAKDASVEALAEDYPEEAFFKKDGVLIAGAGEGGNPKEHFAYENTPRVPFPDETIAGYKSRVRTLPEVVIPAGALRQGVNVLAIEIHRAAYPETALAKFAPVKEPYLRDYVWNTCALLTARLTGDGPAGLVPNTVRPPGIQVWNSQPINPDYDLDYGDPCEPLRPIRIVAPRNGVGSGKVVVGSDQPIRKLEAKVGELTGKEGKIAATAVRVRFALPTSIDTVLARGHFTCPALMMDGLVETAPDEFPVAGKPASDPAYAVYVQPGQPSFVPGAATAVWVTVAPPADAAAGDYTGTLTLSAQGLAKPLEVPVELKVSPWLCPKPGEFHTIVDFIQSPESVALQYNLPLYSDKHWELLEESFRHLGYVGNWTLYVPIICQTNLGNEQSMVRWIKQPDGGYAHDFTVFDRYLDLAEKHMGKPRILCLYVWDVFVGGTDDRFGRSKGQNVGGGDVLVSGMDAAGSVTTISVPGYTEKTKADWQRLADGVRERLKKRGMEEALQLGLCSDAYPTRTITDFWGELMPKVPWARQGHLTWRSGSLGATGAPTDFQATVVEHQFLKDPLHGVYSCLGWKRPDKVVEFLRPNDDPQYPILTMRLLGELNVTGAQRGFGRIGLDFWPVVKSAYTFQTIKKRYPRSSWGMLDMIVESFLPAGNGGAMATARLEMTREGLQEAEARIFIESVLDDAARRAKLGEELAKTAQAVLDERARITLPYMEYQQHAGFIKVDPKGWIGGGIAMGSYYYFGELSPMYYQYYLTTGWQERSEKLFSIAAQVAAKLNQIP
jgi:hypothetical protein